MAYAGWAVVELMGHRRRAGLASEEESFGAKLLRLDIPVGDDGETVTEFYGGGAIYALRPCSEEVGRAAARQLGDPRPVNPTTYRLIGPDAARDVDADDLDDERSL